jgi:hypothetical protein
VFCLCVCFCSDPQQLPPTLPGSDDALLSSFQQTVDGRTEQTGLSRTLFVRMRHAGADTMMLRTQYRSVQQHFEHLPSFCLLGRGADVECINTAAAFVSFLTSCHEMLSRVPNQLFYSGQLLDGTSSAARFPFLVPLHKSSSELPLSPLSFIHVQGRAVGGMQGRGSLYNAEEVEAIARVAQALLIHGVTPEQIGVIAPYRAQVRALTQRFANIQVEARYQQPIAAFATTSSKQKGSKKKGATQTRLPPAAAGAQVNGSSIKISTVDAFQGAEKGQSLHAGYVARYVSRSYRLSFHPCCSHAEIILLATTRVGDSTGFIDNPNRLNVSLTRAKHHLLVFGDRPTLMQSPLFQPIIKLVMSSPGSFRPNVNEAVDRINRLTLNPRLLEERGVRDGDSSDADAPVAANLSMRGVAMNYQQQAEQASPAKKRGFAAAAAAATATSARQVEDDDFIGSDEEEEDGEDEENGDEEDEEDSVASFLNQYRHKKKSDVSTAGLSPYSRNLALSVAKDDAPPQTDDGAAASLSAAPSAISLVDVLERDIKREQAHRRAQAARSRPRVNYDDEEDDEGEATYEPPVPQNQDDGADAVAVSVEDAAGVPMSDEEPASSSAGSGEVTAQVAPAPADPATAAGTGAPDPPPTPRPIATSLRAALSRSSSAASSACETEGEAGGEAGSE